MRLGLSKCAHGMASISLHGTVAPFTCRMDLLFIQEISKQRGRVGGRAIPWQCGARGFWKEREWKECRVSIQDMSH